MRCAAAVLTLVLLGAASPTALAWNKPGHMVIGAIAYDELSKDDPKTLARGIELNSPNIARRVDRSGRRWRDGRAAVLRTGDQFPRLV
jgi:hypothetical protein